MATQVGNAVALFSKDKNITHEEFVQKFLEVHPTQTAYIAALYWQNKKRRASFGLTPVKLPEIYSPTGVVKAPKDSPKPVKTKEVSAKKLLKEVEIGRAHV